MNRRAALAAAAAALFLTGAPALSAEDAAEALVRCEGVNSCKAKSDCHTANNACAGQNACKGQGMLELTRDNREAIEAVKELYEPFVRTGNPILIMDSRSAEMRCPQGARGKAYRRSAS